MDAVGMALAVRLLLNPNDNLSLSKLALRLCRGAFFVGARSVRQLILLALGRLTIPQMQLAADHSQDADRQSANAASGNGSPG
jgi:hypothetical protein